MTSIIKGITYFQDIDLQEKHFNTRVLFDDRLEQLLDQHSVFSNITALKQRFRKNVDYITFSNNVVLEPYCSFEVSKFYHPMGSFSYSRSVLPLNTIVGRYTSIANGVQRMGINHPIDRFSTSSVTYNDNGGIMKSYFRDYGKKFEVVPIENTEEGPIVIGNDVWIGQDVLFSSKGIVVGDGAVIAARSVVTKDVPPYAVVAGNPARIVKYRFSSEVIDELLTLKWWKYDYGKFSDFKADNNIKYFIEMINKLDESGTEKFIPSTLKLMDIKSL